MPAKLMFDGYSWKCSTRVHSQKDDGWTAYYSCCGSQCEARMVVIVIVIAIAIAIAIVVVIVIVIVIVVVVVVVVVAAVFVFFYFLLFFFLFHLLQILN